jgi:hypothetical protein
MSSAFATGSGFFQWATEAKRKREDDGAVGRG